MKKIIIAIIIVLIASNIYTQEMQVSGGFEGGFGIYKVDNNFCYTEGNISLFIKEKINSTFFAPGISFTIRVFPDTDNDISVGWIFRDRAIFMTNIKHNGYVSVTGYPGPIYESESISETISISEDFDFFIGIMDFGMGESVRFKIFNSLHFYADFGVNFTKMDYEDYKTSDTSNYLGFGIFSDLALQVNLTTNLYLEFGANSIINIFSSLEGTHTYQMQDNTKHRYEDSGRWDLISVAPYIHIGWRFDLRKIRGQ